MTPSDGARPTVIPLDLAWFGFLKGYLLRGERTIVVDAGYPFSSDRLDRSLAKHRVRPEDVSLILLTHGHLDHLGGAKRLRDRLGAPVALHRLDAEVARTGRGTPLIPTSLAGRLFVPFAPKTAPSFEPDIIHDGELDLAPYGVSGRTMHTPGHTPGSISVLLDDCVLAGDLVAGGFLRATSPRLPYFADDLDQLTESMRRVVAVAGGPLHVGHRGPIEPAAVARRFLEGRR